MIFNSFIVMFPPIFLLYYVIPAKYGKTRNMFLLIVSYLLYLQWKPLFALILLGLTAVTFYTAILVEKAARAKSILTIGVLMAALPLVFFKYFNFINDNISEVLSLIGLNFHLQGLNWASPIGILYRYNSKFQQIAADFVYPIYEIKAANGFLPLNEELDTMRIKQNSTAPAQTPQLDQLKIAYLNKFIDESDGVQLIFTVSPIWYGISTNQLTPIQDICQQHGIPFLDFSNDPKYVHNNKTFMDGAHLNAFGADEFTKDLATELRKRGILK